MGQRAKAGEDRARERNLIRCLLGRCFEAERNRERPALRLGELFGDVRESTIQQVAEPTEREGHFHLGTPRREHPDTGLLCGLKPGAPENGFSDSGLASDDDRARTLRDACDELAQPGEFRVAPDDAGIRTYDHRKIVVRRKRGF